MRRLGLLFSLCLLACDSAELECEGVVATPLSDSVNFGDLRLGEGVGQDGDLTVPERLIYFLKNDCGDTLEVTSVCLVNNTHNGDPETPAFYLELEPGSTLPLSIRPSKRTGIRITYEVDSVSGDVTGDGEADADRAVLVIHSNSSENPIIAAPVCARAVSDGEPVPLNCELPPNFEAPPSDTGDCIR